MKFITQLRTRRSYVRKRCQTLTLYDRKIFFFKLPVRVGVARIQTREKEVRHRKIN